MQLCHNCRYTYHSTKRIPCLCCDSKFLTIHTTENLIEIVNRLLNMGIEVVSSSCDVHNVYDDTTGKRLIGTTVQLQIELGCLYPTEMLNDPPLPPGWATYTYHTIVDSQIGPAYSGLCHVDSFTNGEECEFATMVTISNLICWLDDRDATGFYSVWRLAGAI